MKTDNRILRACLLPLGVLAVLFLLQWLPDIDLAGHHLRPVDPLSRLRPEPRRTPMAELLADTLAEPTPLDTLPKASAHAIVQADSLTEQIPIPRKPIPLRPDTIAIVDYDPTGNGHGMGPFYRALRRLMQVDTAGVALDPRPVRIAYFGDSFVEGDILTADLRYLLQARFGGSGPGFVPITSMVNRFRPTVVHNFSGWQSYSVMKGSGFNPDLQGLSGQYFTVAGPSATVSLSGTSRYLPRLDTCQVASLVFLAREEVEVSMTVNRADTLICVFHPADSLQEMQTEGRIGQVEWSVARADSSVFYGMVMDDATGVVVDNFALRSNSGRSLRSVSEVAMRRFADWRPYDLIVLHYGLNVASEDRTDYSAYTKGMQTVIGQLKDCFPSAGILIISVSDRNQRNAEGELRTLPGIVHLVQSQHRMAADEEVAFWNLFLSMGGEESMLALVDADPPMANTDYTHLNFRGGRFIAELLYNALMQGYEEWIAEQGVREAEPEVLETESQEQEADSAEQEADERRAKE